MSRWPLPAHPPLSAMSQWPLHAHPPPCLPQPQACSDACTPLPAGYGSSVVASDVLWSDPVAVDGLETNDARGVGLIFGPNITQVCVGCVGCVCVGGAGWTVECGAQGGFGFGCGASPD